MIATDLDSVIPLIERNIERNELNTNVKAMPLFWGNEQNLQAVMNEA